MGYGYGFLLSLVKLPEEILSKLKDDDSNFYELVEPFVLEIAVYCKELEITDIEFPLIAVKQHAGSKSNSCGPRENLLSSIMKLSLRFPGTIFAIYHFYWDFYNLTIYTFSDSKLLGEHNMNLEFQQIGPYCIGNPYSFFKVSIPNNLTCFFNKDKCNYDFEWIDIEFKELI